MEGYAREGETASSHGVVHEVGAGGHRRRLLVPEVRNWVRPEEVTQ